MKPAPTLLIIATLAGLLAACDKSTESRGDAERPGRSASQDPAEGPRYADADRNGRVTREEAGIDPALAASFERYDANADGELDRAEFARLESGAMTGSRGAGSPEQDEHHTLRPREEFPRPLD